MVELTHYLLCNHGKLASTSTCFLTWLPGCNSFFQHNFGWSHVGSAKPFGYNVVYTILLVQLVTQLLNCDGFLLLAWLLVDSPSVGLVLGLLHLPPGPPPIFMQWWHWIPWSQRGIGDILKKTNQLIELSNTCLVPSAKWMATTGASFSVV